MEAANLAACTEYAHEKAGLSGFFGEKEEVEVVVERRNDEFNDDFEKQGARSLFLIGDLRNEEFEETGP